MSTYESDVVAAKLREEWDSLSRKNALHYIASLREQWNEDEFLESGEADVKEFVDPYVAEVHFCPEDKRMLEIGCGVGRMTFALARRFGSIVAVDISEEMITRAKALQKRLNSTKIEFHTSSGKDLSLCDTASIDFCFSFIVLQHIPSVAMVLNYFREIGRVLVPGGAFKVQVNGYHSIRLPRAYYLLWGTCATHRLRKWNIYTRPHARFGKLDGWGGVPISKADIHSTCRAAGLADIDIKGYGTQFMWVSGRKSLGVRDRV
jgi:ubiquinone/menaquinone biosynthesis C-methylase UbiE